MKKFTLLFFSFLLFVLGGVKAQTNLALGKDAFASSVSDENGGLTPDKAVDGDMGTKWASNYGTKGNMTDDEKNAQWFMVDLGSTQDFNTVQISWDNEPAAEFEIRYTDEKPAVTDGSPKAAGTVVATITETGTVNGTNTYTFDGVKAQYVIINFIKRGSGFGYGINELKVFNKQGAGTLDVFELESSNSLVAKNGTSNITITAKDNYGDDFTLEGVTYTVTPSGVGTIAGNVFTANGSGWATITASATNTERTAETKIFIYDNELTPAPATFTDKGVLYNGITGQWEPEVYDWGSKQGDLDLGTDGKVRYAVKLGTIMMGCKAENLKGYKYIHFDVFPLKDCNLNVSLEGAVTTDTYIDVIGGKWNSIDVLIEDFGDITNARFLKLRGKNQGQDDTDGIIIKNIYATNNDDGVDPEISSTLVKGISVGSATFEIVANDNSDELKYKVVAVDKDNNTYSAEVKGGKGYPVTLRIEGLVHNTTYTATVTVSDGFRSVKEEGITFTTKELPHAVKLSPAATKYYYDNHDDDLDAHISGYVTSGYDNVGSFDDHAGFDVKEITIGNVIENDTEIPDNVLKFTGKKGGTFTDAFGIGILGTDEFGINDGKDYLVRFAIYPVDIDEIEYAGKIYLEKDNFKTRKVIPNQWNYISFKPLENYEGTNNFTGILIRCKKGKTVYLDNFCYYTSSDKTPPVITEYKIGKTFATSASMSIKGYDKNGENQSLTGMLKYEIWVEDANGTRQAALVRGENNVENPVEVAAYVRGIAPDADNKAKIWVIARDAAENQAKTDEVEVTFATVLDKSINVESFEEKENIEDAYNVTDKSVVLTDKSHGGLIILNGQWDATAFNKIAAKYPYSCFDMRNVKFTDDNRIDHGDGTNGTITVFNPNTYFITDVTNKFDGNYATYEADGSLMAMNMHWFDGEWKWNGDDVPDGRVNYQEIVKANTNEGETYLGISSFGYIKLDPYTGFDLVVREQGCGITRDVKVPEKENKYSTVICPFSLNTSSDYVAGSRFYELETPSVITDGDNNTTVTLNFTEITGKTKPNTPYLVRLAEGTKSLYFVDEDKDIKKTIVFPKNVEEMKGETATDGNVSAYMFGTYITRTLSGPTDVYGLKQGNQTLTLVTPKEGKKIEIPAFRAAMKLTQIPSNAKSILISFDGETTGITSIDNDVINAVLGNIYSIDGKKVGNTSNGMINLPAGIYIVNGKKVVVK